MLAKPGKYSKYQQSFAKDIRIKTCLKSIMLGFFEGSNPKSMNLFHFDYVIALSFFL